MRSFLYTKVHRTGLKTTYRVYEVKKNMLDKQVIELANIYSTDS